MTDGVRQGAPRQSARQAGLAQTPAGNPDAVSQLRIERRAVEMEMMFYTRDELRREGPYYLKQPRSPSQGAGAAPPKSALKQLDPLVRRQKLETAKAALDAAVQNWRALCEQYQPMSETQNLVAELDAAEKAPEARLDRDKCAATGAGVGAAVFAGGGTVGYVLAAPLGVAAAAGIVSGFGVGVLACGAAALYYCRDRRILQHHNQVAENLADLESQAKDTAETIKECVREILCLWGPDLPDSRNDVVHALNGAQTVVNQSAIGLRMLLSSDIGAVEFSTATSLHVLPPGGNAAAAQETKESKATAQSPEVPESHAAGAADESAQLLQQDQVPARQ